MSSEYMKTDAGREQKEVHQQQTHDSAREQEREKVNTPTPDQKHEPGEEHPQESLEEQYRDKGGKENVPKSQRDKEA